MHVVILIDNQFKHHLKMFAAASAIIEKNSFLMVLFQLSKKTEYLCSVWFFIQAIFTDQNNNFQQKSFIPQ